MYEITARNLRTNLDLEDLRNIVNNLKCGAWTAVSHDIDIIVANYIDGETFNDFIRLVGL
jgi:hypothetical protein